MNGYFVTATDTNMGKTTVSCRLLREWAGAGEKTAALKPVASGCIRTAEGLRSEDALKLRAAMTMDFPYDVVNPYAFEPPIAPHIAAKNTGMTLNVASLVARSVTVMESGADKVVIEGAGGWAVPLNAKETLADYAAAMGLPVILVVGMRLGCINHALLTVDAILAKGLTLSAWFANVIDPNMLELTENINTLVERIPAPCHTVIPYFIEQI